MIRFWLLAILLSACIGGESEARGRHRVMRYQGSSWQSRPSFRYAPSATQPVYSTTTPGKPSQVIQPVSLSSSVGNVVSASSTAPASSNEAASNTAATSKVSTTSVSNNLATMNVSVHPLQAWAEEEARMMASRGTCGHIRPAPPGCFVGVGCGMTCMGYGQLVAEASFQGKMVRVWQR